jgi:dTDP-4-dehydrorhamnose 3,5-epimerase
MSKIDIHPRRIPGLFDVEFTPFQDNRGELFKFYEPKQFKPIRENLEWRQVIISKTEKAGTLRGVHAQVPPFVECKLLVPLTGKMFWVAVDLRRGSQTFGEWDSVVLEPERPVGLYAERGFAHGCYSLEDKTDLLILADNDYAAGLGIHWRDPDLGIEWPLLGEGPVLSGIHAELPSFKQFCSQYGGL